MSQRKSSPIPLLLVLGAIGIGVLAWFLFFSPTTDPNAEVPIWTVGRGPLRVTVVEGGSLEALESHTVVSGVEGRAAILAIVDEGTIITLEDVEAGLLLVQLDSSGLEEKLERQKIDLAQARSAHENAVSNLEIQLQQNASDIRKAELEARFAALDLARYVGSGLVASLRAACVSCEPGAPDEARSSEPGAALRDLLTTLLDREELEGEALQMIRKHDSDIQLAEEEFTRAQVDYDWSLKLSEKGYVSIEEKEADRLALERRRIELDRARTARGQFREYDFPKNVEQFLSNLIEAEDQLSRTEKRARSAEAKALADRDSRQEQRTLQEARHAKLTAQLSACNIHADRPGLVVFASSGRRRRWDSGERIKKGATVHERQAIITIPDLTQLGVSSDIHESLVKRVADGQSVTVIIDALPKTPLRGTVVNVAALPNAAENWFNPDRKVYSTSIRLESAPATARPGMSARVEILIEEKDDVLLLPVQAVAGTADHPVAYVVGETDTVERPVKLGLSNDRFAEVLSGLEAGERVLLAPPRSERLGGDNGNGKKGARPAGKQGRPAGKSGGRPRGGGKSGKSGANG